MKNSTRRYVFTFIILFVAGGVSWWSSHTASSVSNHVHNEVAKLVPRFHSDPSSIHTIVVDPVIESVLAMSLEFVYQESKKRNEEFVVIVTSGDNEEYGDGTATHVAVFQINEKAVASLRVICPSDSSPLRIAGVYIEGQVGEMETKTP